MGCSSLSGSAHVGEHQGGRGCVAAGSSLHRTSNDVTSGLSPSVRVGGCPDILGSQGAQRVQREIVGLGFARRRSCAEGLPPSEKRAGMPL